MRTTENTSDIRPLTDVELDELSGGSLLTEVWHEYQSVYDKVFFKYAPLEGHLHR
jgi:hypothetical protein